MLGLQIALALVYFSLFSMLVYRWSWFRIEGLSPKVVLGGFWLKLFFGFLFYAVYTYYYPADHSSDAFSYFEEGKILNAVFYDNPVDFMRLLFTTKPTDPHLQEYVLEMDRWNRSVSYGVLNDNPTIIKFNALVLFFSLGYYHTHTLFMGFVCFSGLMLLYRFFSRTTSHIPQWQLFAAVILPPSLLFWSGGVLKEGLLLFGLGLLFYCITECAKKNYIGGIAGIIAAVILLLYAKAYVLIAFSPGILFFALVQVTSTKHLWFKFLGLHAVLFGLVFSLGYWVNDYNVLHMFQLKQRDFYSLVNSMSVGSMITIPPINNTFDIILLAPQAIFNTYFRPHLLEANSFTFLASALENLFYGLLIVVAILRFRKPNPKEAAVALMCLSCIAGLGVLVGLVTPVLGAIVRYKIPALPFLIILCLLIMKPWSDSVISRFTLKINSLTHS